MKYFHQYIFVTVVDEIPDIRQMKPDIQLRYQIMAGWGEGAPAGLLTFFGFSVLRSKMVIGG